MKKIEVNTHSDRVELETDIAAKAIKHLHKHKYLEVRDLIVFDEEEDCTRYTKLGQAIFNDIVDVLSGYIKVKEDEIEYDLDDDYDEMTKEELLMDIYNKLIFTDDTYILPDGTELTNFDRDYVKSLEFDKIKHYLK